MKSHSNRPGWAPLLGDQVLRAVLADELDPGLGQGRQLLRRHVLDRRADLHLGRPIALAHPLEVLPHARGVEAAELARHPVSHATPPWRPVTPSSRRWEKNRSSRQCVHRSTCSTSRHPAGAQLALGHGAQVEHAARRPRRRGPRTRPAPPAPPRSSSARCRAPPPPRAARRRAPAPSRRSPRPARASRSAASPRARRRPAPPAGSRPPARAGRGRARAVMCPSTWRAPRRASAKPSRPGGGGRPNRRCRCRAPASPSRRGRGPARRCAASRARFSRHPLRASSVSTPRLSESYGASLTPPLAGGERHPAPGRATSKVISLMRRPGPARARRAAPRRGPTPRRRACGAASRPARARGRRGAARRRPAGPRPRSPGARRAAR